ncbi:DUF1365 domain-containing protein [Prosthecomicrobium sp. N25]|uniref:DUF1365 domain-containing protein n=1 Tax=Prosthecomicrobium sp. N25 TaxID=3129254 RepID=UPI003078A4A4
MPGGIHRVPTTAAENGSPPAEAVSLCEGPVMHARLKPVGHRFAYTIASLLVDIDRLDEANRRSRLFSVGRFNLFSLHERDHGPADGSPLRPWIDRGLAAAGLSERPERVLLLASPRVLGYVFNPLSVYFCFGGGARPVALVYEVRNTFGERHTYFAPVGTGEEGPEGIRQSRAKLFHVSPFLPMAMRYLFRVLPPGRSLRIRILETDADGPLLAATYQASIEPLTSAALVRSFLRIPWVTLKIIGAIHFEAARLWLKGVPFFSKPAAPAPVSVGDGVVGPGRTGAGTDRDVVWAEDGAAPSRV